MLVALCHAAAAQQTPLQELVRAAIQNEINDDSAHSRFFSWKERKYRDNVPLVQRVVDTPGGDLSRVILINDKPLTQEQRNAENERIRRMLNPTLWRRKQKEQREDDERTHRMLVAIPEAFDFVYLDSVQASNGHKLIHLRFTARPGFVPPTRESMVFTGMQGEMLIDETARHIAKIDGSLFKDVNFGWGILGRLYKGGRFVVEQSEVTPSHWDTTRMILHFDGKALLFKSIHIDDNSTSWDYQPVPPMSVEQALQYLARSETPQDARLTH